ncbi:LOW QUALITY PROTEIN: hypothetical protein HID58_064934, partial [Brassica napus]
RYGEGSRYLPQQGMACTQHHTTLETASQPSKELAIAATKSLHQTGLTSLSHTNRERALMTCTKLATLHYQCRIKRPFTGTGMVATTKSDTATTKTKAGTTLAAFENRRTIIVTCKVNTGVNSETNNISPRAQASIEMRLQSIKELKLMTMMLLPERLEKKLNGHRRPLNQSTQHSHTRSGPVPSPPAHQHPRLISEQITGEALDFAEKEKNPNNTIETRSTNHGSHTPPSDSSSTAAPLNPRSKPSTPPRTQRSKGADSTGHNPYSPPRRETRSGHTSIAVENLASGT